MASASVLEARKLTVSAMLGGESVPVLRELSFSLNAGQVLGLVGESGAGKSMVGRTVAQLLPPGFAVPMPSDDPALRDDEDPLEPGDLDFGLAPPPERAED